MPTWLCFQIGAREHYAVPRALQLSGSLGELITDLWVHPGTLLYYLLKRLTVRFHPELANACVTAPNGSALTFELKASLKGDNGWKRIGRRNEWFQRQAVAQLARNHHNGNHTVFAYSYAAAEIFKFARARGWRTVMGQIDLGPADERIIGNLHHSAGLEDKWSPAPKEHWDNWRVECSLADRIVVNSAWSREALLNEGISAEKIRLIPLAYDPPTDASSFQRHYPRAFSSERPLRVLFLGQISLRKGILPLLDAVKLLAREDVQFWFVGPVQIDIADDLGKLPQCKWFGIAPRVEVSEYYRHADVFILPTFSDGFALTQLEAQAWKLPVIASRYCGEVVHDGFNGVILEEISGEAIADVLLQFLKSPETLSAMSVRSGVSDRFTLRRLASSLSNLTTDLPT